jgi:hypothetical protein
MEVPSILQGESLKRLAQGAFVGFLATVVIGFNWGGWTLGSTAKEMAEKSANIAIVATLAKACVDNFQQAANATGNLSELKKIGYSWDQGTYIEKGGWAKTPHSDKTDLAVAEACAKALTASQ